MRKENQERLIELRAAEKIAARAADAARMKAGVSPDQIQRENSAVNGAHIRGKPISNFAEAMDWCTTRKRPRELLGPAVCTDGFGTAG